LHEREPATGEAAAKLVAVAQEERADPSPSVAQGLFDVVHGGDCTVFVW
jgi:hypothetical protein